MRPWRCALSIIRSISRSRTSCRCARSNVLFVCVSAKEFLAGAKSPLRSNSCLWCGYSLERKERKSSRSYLSDSRVNWDDIGLARWPSFPSMEGSRNCPFSSCTVTQRTRREKPKPKQEVTVRETVDCSLPLLSIHWATEGYKSARVLLFAVRKAQQLTTTRDLLRTLQSHHAASSQSIVLTMSRKTGHIPLGVSSSGVTMCKLEVTGIATSPV